VDCFCTKLADQMDRGDSTAKDTTITRPGQFSRRTLAAIPIALAVTWCGLAAVRALYVRHSAPTAETIIHGDHAQYVIRFDGPVNHFASHMEITQGTNVVETLTPLDVSAVDVLFASGAVPRPGRYLLHWEAVSADGDTTKGDIPFNVE
jgi:methionine-rich copper-binding protein CopC